MTNCCFVASRTLQKRVIPRDARYMHREIQDKPSQSSELYFTIGVLAFVGEPGTTELLKLGR